MIYFTGDTHGDVYYRIKDCPAGKKDKPNYLIICGDFGLNFYDIKLNDNFKEAPEYVFFNKNIKYINNDFNQYKKVSKLLEEKNIIIIALMGNHENYDKVKEMPNGYIDFKKKVGDVHWGYPKIFKAFNIVCKNIFVVDRNSILEVENKKIAFFPGGKSHDYDIILEPEEWLNLGKDFRKHYRINHLTWWKEEMPNIEDLLHDISKMPSDVDYIVSHQNPSIFKKTPWIRYDKFQYIEDINYLELALDYVYNNFNFEHWFHGHRHYDTEQYAAKIECLYGIIVDSNGNYVGGMYI